MHIITIYKSLNTFPSKIDQLIFCVDNIWVSGIPVSHDILIKIDQLEEQCKEDKAIQQSLIPLYICEFSHCFSILFLFFRFFLVFSCLSFFFLLFLFFYVQVCQYKTWFIIVFFFNSLITLF